MDLLVGMIAGAFGTVVAALILRRSSLGLLGNSIVGILGGGIAAHLVAILSDDNILTGSVGSAALIGQAVAGAIGGVALLCIIGAIRAAIAR